MVVERGGGMCALSANREIEIEKREAAAALECAHCQLNLPIGKGKEGKGPC